MTSRWIDEVATLRNLDVTWHVMSLAVLNEGKELSEKYIVLLARARRYTAFLQAAAELHGPAVLKPLYDALGARIHPDARKDVDAIIAESLAEAGLPADLIRFADSDEYDAQLRVSHHDAIARVGHDVGTPVIAVGEHAFFGPVISPAPKGEQAAALWDGVVALSSFDGFFELKRSRTREPSFD